MIALIVVSLGIASIFLMEKKLHIQFLNLPLYLANKEQILKDHKLVVCNDCKMIHKAATEPLDQMSQDLGHNNKLMGCVILVLAGDFH